MQNRGATRNDRAPQRTTQQINALRLRVLQAKAGFMGYGSDVYMPYIDAQATREGLTLDAAAKMEIRQVMNGRLDVSDTPTVELIERALQALKAA